MKKGKASTAVRERLRLMRQKYHLGEYSNKSRTRNPKIVRVRKRRITGGVIMRGRKRIIGRKSFAGSSGAGSLIKGALYGIAGAHLAGYIPVNIPMKEEVAGALTAYAMNKNIKSAGAGAVAVFLTKKFSLTNTGSSVGLVLN